MKVVDGAKVFIKNKKLSKYLFFLRDNKPNIPSPNMWGMLGGGINEGESPLEALTREIGEETNIKLYNIEELGEKRVTLTVQGKKYPITAYYFLAYTDFNLEEIELFEGQKVGYFDLDEFKARADVAHPILEITNEYKDKLK